MFSDLLLSVIYLIHQPWSSGRTFRICMAFYVSGLHVPVSYAGIISMIIAAGTVISSLQSDRLTKNLAPVRLLPSV